VTLAEWVQTTSTGDAWATFVAIIYAGVVLARASTWWIYSK
jgi:hypothetical protein